MKECGNQGCTREIFHTGICCVSVTRKRTRRPTEKLVQNCLEEFARAVDKCNLCEQDLELSRTLTIVEDTVVDLESVLPDVVYRPGKYQCLTVDVDRKEADPEFDTDTIREVYTEMKTGGDRFERLEILKGVDLEAFLLCEEECHIPPSIRV